MPNIVTPSRIQAINDWINNYVEFDRGAWTSSKDILDSLANATGIQAVRIRGGLWKKLTRAARDDHRRISRERCAPIYGRMYGVKGLRIREKPRWA